MKKVIGSHRVHPMADYSNSDNCTDESEKIATNISEALSTKDEESNRRVNMATEIPDAFVTIDAESNTRLNSALIVTFCESPHR